MKRKGGDGGGQPGVGIGGLRRDGGRVGAGRRDLKSRVESMTRGVTRAATKLCLLLRCAVQVQMQRWRGSVGERESEKEEERAAR